MKKYLAILIIVIIGIFCLSACEEETSAEYGKAVLVKPGFYYNIIDSSVRFDDLDAERQKKLADFCEVSVDDWRSVGIFRNLSYNVAALCINRDMILDDDWMGTGGHYALPYGKYKSINEISSDFKVTYVNGHKKLKKDEIIVSRWIYNALYAVETEVKIDLDKANEIIDSDNVYAKYLVLRNGRGPAYIEGLVLSYYGVLPDKPTREIKVDISEYLTDNVAEKTIVGWYDDRSDTLEYVGGYRTDRDHIVGFNVKAALERSTTEEYYIGQYDDLQLRRIIDYFNTSMQHYFIA